MYPATEDLIKKYSSSSTHLVRQTPEMYNNVTKPLFIDQIDHSTHNGWIYNILEGKKETENLIFETDQYKLMKDWEFNEGDV